MNFDALLRIKADVQGENNIRRLGNSLQGVQGHAKNLAQDFGRLKAGLAAFGAAVTGGAIAGFIKQSIDAGDTLFKLQQQTGIASKQLIGISNAAKLADVDMGQLQKSLIKLGINLTKAAEGNDKLERQFKSLGIEVKQSNGQLIPADQALKQIANRFADMPDGAQKAAAAVALFGKSGADMIPILNEGSASMEKFTYKVSDDFAARSDKFNDTLTEFGISVNGFGLELTDALLPALQSILEEFGKLFNTKQDWTALFEVIKIGLRAVATALYATIKLVDQWMKISVTAFDAIGKAVKGDFIGAGRAIVQGVSSGIDQAKRDFSAIQRLWTDAPIPMRRAGTRPIALDTTESDRKAQRQADKQRRAEEERQNDLLGLLQDYSQKRLDLIRKIRDAQAETATIGASPMQQITNEFNAALAKNKDMVDDAAISLIRLTDDLRKAGLPAKSIAEIYNTIRDSVNQLSKINVDNAIRQQSQALVELLPPLQTYNDLLNEIKANGKQLTEVQKLDNELKRLGLDLLIQTNPALAEQVRLLRDRAKTVDDERKKQEDQSKSFKGTFSQQLKEYYRSVVDFGSQVGSAVINAFEGITDVITELVITGKASFADLAKSILADMTKILIRATIIKPLLEAVGSLTGIKFANGGIMTASGEMPLKKYAGGGIATSPQLALFGEGSRPEAFVPLPDGRRIPVAMQGGAGASVTVNVDARGTSAQGDQGKGSQLARAIAAAVQSELIKQKRPGGILATA